MELLETLPSEKRYINRLTPVRVLLLSWRKVTELSKDHRSVVGPICQETLSCASLCLFWPLSKENTIGKARIIKSLYSQYFKSKKPILRPTEHLYATGAFG